mmetsp:Transcript_10881/g.16224  ORF Transcript_10881/g.16224 Transcript_10881/m.16224 type:complete len:381 (-) Transcript_10881:90-1232(-)|eukprot:CAMPEP_0167754070 /NCGR_PEP_ID=MMETSP0110_2-20121227/8066_1 /TAXON_ID=629695 /ORGANISM="Gymnochlora sp., Strain CCMP2014" /LENGTH=380 /DNA_ID=CAMNT_0007639909 /DNA_START=119 /DNA_END=1261 /DNA_ORIENTATION=-
MNGRGGIKRRGFQAPKLNINSVSEQKSYRVDQSTFQHGDITITNEGLQTDGAESSTKLKFEELKLQEKLGAGASGTVHRAEYKGKSIAIKIMDIFQREKRHQLLKEIRSMSKMESPFVASFMGAFFLDGSIYIALEYLDAGSLEDILKVTTFPIPAIRVVATQLSMGLESLHKLRHMHRDIKPSNICLNTKGEAKFTDFGIAREVKETVGVAKTFIGTCTYMSPERISGKEYSYNSDVWSLGLSLLQCVVGRYPYSVNGVYLDLMQQIVQNPAPKLEHTDKDKKGPPHVRKMRQQFREFIALALQKDPKKRCQASALVKNNFTKCDNLEKDKTKFSQWLKKVKHLKPKQKQKTEKIQPKTPQKKSGRQPIPETPHNSPKT